MIVTAFQSLPSFVNELKDERAVENETIVFDCQFSGNPTPGSNIRLLLFHLLINKLLIIY